MSKGAGLGLAVAGVVTCALPSILGQTSAGLGQNASLADPFGEAKARSLPDRVPDKPSLPPTFFIPVEPLGFTAPAPNYLGLRWCFVSLDFLDENRLLFTFRVPGLLHRDPGDRDDTERQIRAVVVELPDGKVEAEALWTVHDRLRYLWMLKDRHFLLRDRDTVRQGDAKLELKPLLQFPGPLTWMELDPTQQFLVTNSREPAASSPKPGEVASPPTAAANIVADGQMMPAETNPGKTDLVVRILRRESGQVMLVSRVRSTVHLPINSDGYLEGLRANGQEWLLNLNYFAGGSTMLGRVNSSCAPAFDFVSQWEVLAAACPPSGGRKLVAMSTSGRRLWEVQTSGDEIWPRLVMAQDGSRLAYETVVLNHSFNDLTHPLDAEDMKGQMVRVFDAADGRVTLEAPASPTLDAGGNIAISPSGRRVALLNAGAIQVFDLPPAAPMTEAGGNQGGP
jgi:hypothetical protein